MTPMLPFLTDLMAAAGAAKAAESNYRREAAVRIAELEQERAFAFRRSNLMQAIADTVASEEAEEIAVARALATLRARLGWGSDSEAQAEVLDHFSPVAAALFHALLSGDPAAEIGDRLSAFEDWYSSTRNAPFWEQFETVIADTPRVDF
jgi:hypothetical protein